MITLLISTSPRARTAVTDEQITGLEQALAAAHTVEQIMAFYSPGDDTVVYDALVPGLLRGKKAIAANFSAQLARTRSVKIDIRELTVGSSGSIGYAFSIQHAAITNLDGSSTDVTYRQTDVWRRSGGHWYITHQQTSYPADPMTGSTQFNSAP